MLTLEHVHLVQFFLFEAETISLGDVCGVFGPNGSGKSSFIDSVQIGMLGGSARLVALNAQADERHTTRSIRGYCLGQYGEGPDQRVRDHSTTYVTLVWRNRETHETVSMGVCMQASGDGDGHEVMGRYIAPGVDLSLGDHLEGEGDRKRPRDWKAFRTDLVRRAKASSDEDILFPTADRYVQAALLRLQGSGGIPDQKLFTRAFRFGLRMRFDKSVDQIVRDEVLESRPTEIKRFKETMDSMRAIQQMVAKVKQQIAAGEKVDEAYAIADRHARREVAWEAIGLDVEAERKRDQANDAQVKLQAAADVHQGNVEEMNICEKAFATAKTEFETAVELRNAHAAHKDLEQYRTEAAKKRKDANKHAATLTQYLRDINAVAGNVSVSECLKEMKGEIKTAQETLSAVISVAHADLDDDHLASAVKASIKALRQAWSALARESQGLHGQIEANEKDRAVVAENLQRADQGQVELSRHVIALKQHLADHGVESTPVCDVVRVTDPRWQPVIEGYLGQSNLEALVVSDKEEEAFRLYRSLSGKGAIYGAKLVLANRLKRQDTPKDSVAALIDGNHSVAVDYVRSIFGSIRQAETNEEALGHARTLTPDGMLMGGAAVDRIKPAPQLRLGVTPAQRIGHLKAELSRLEREHQKLVSSKRAVDSLLALIAEVPGEDKALSQIATLRKEYQDAIREEKNYQNKLHDMDDAGYAVLEKKVKAAEVLLTERNDKRLAAATALGSSESKLENASSAAERAQTSATLAGKAAEAFRSSKVVDEAYVAAEWDKLLKEMAGEDRYARMLARADSRRRNQAEEKTGAVNRGNNALGDFLREYREPIQDDVRNDWRCAWEWMQAILARLKGTELHQYETEANEAVERAKEIFRADVAFCLSENLQRLDDTFASLNAVLRTCPVFSNGERYRFHRRVRPDYADLLTFVKNVATYGSDESLFGSAGEIPQQFLDLLEEATTLGTGSQRTPLDDYREFYEFDIEILRAPAPDEPFKVIGHLSKRIGPGSGGEHRSPLYVIAGAALASAYRINGKDRTDGIRLILLDEAFNKMDPNNITATMRYFEDLGLQVFMASPGENLGTLTAFLHRYYDIVRDAENNAIHVTGHNVTEAARQLMRSDMVEFHPDLLTEELTRAPAATLAAVEG